MHTTTKEEPLLQILTSPTSLFMAVVLISLYVPNTTYLAITGLAFWPIALYLLWSNQPLQKAFFKQPEITCLLIFCGYCLISLLWSPWNQPVLIIKEVVRVVIVIGLTFLFGFIAADKRILQLDLYWVCILSISACYLLLNTPTIDFDAIWKSQRFITEPGLFYHHSPIGWMFAASILLSIPRLITSPIRGKILFSLAILVALIVIIIAQSRAAYLGLIAGLFIFAVAKGGKVGVFVLVTVAAIALTFIAAYLLTDIPLIDSLIKRGDANRHIIYSNAFNAIIQKPWFGHGFSALAENDVLGQFTAMHYHNIYLSVTFYGGVIGLSVFLLLAGYSFIKNFKQASSQGWYSVLIMALVIFLFDGNHFISYPSGELYILIVPVLIMAAIRTHQYNESFKVIPPYP